MSFWLNEENTQEENLGMFEMGGGEIAPIPNKTQVLAFIDEIKWEEYQGDSYISARWNVIKPEEYKNRKIFQKIRVNDEKDEKAAKAKRMLMAIDYNAKGGLAASGKEPTTELMQSKLTNKPMVIMLQVWSIEDKESGEMKRGNWISAVSPKTAGTPDKVIPIVRETKVMSDDEAADLAF
jgi:hypothetical protein